MNEDQKDWLQSAYNTLQKTWKEQHQSLQDSNGVFQVTLVPEELHALKQAAELALEL